MSKGYTKEGQVMEIEKNTVDKFKDRQPFRVPEGYFDNFTKELMDRLPEKSVAEPPKISLYNRIQPWLYMAAVFAGLLVLFHVLNYTAGISKEGGSVTVMTSTSDKIVNEEEDAEFLDYMEEMYTDKYAISYIYDFLDN